MGFSTTRKNAILDSIFVDGDFDTNLYVGLSTTDPLADGSGVTEPSGGSYARVQMDPNATTPGNWDAAAAGVTTNTIHITFPEATAGWGTCQWVVFYDAGTGGNFIAYAVFKYSSDAAINSYLASSVSGTIDDSGNPVVPYNDALVTDIFTVEFVDEGSTYKVTGNSTGHVGQGVVASDQYFADPDDGELLFMIPSAFWGGTWASGETVQFSLQQAVSGALNVQTGYIPRIRAGDLEITI